MKWAIQNDRFYLVFTFYWFIQASRANHTHKLDSCCRSHRPAPKNKLSDVKLLWDVLEYSGYIIFLKKAKRNILSLRESSPREVESTKMKSFAHNLINKWECYIKCVIKHSRRDPFKLCKYTMHGESEFNVFM